MLVGVCVQMERSRVYGYEIGKLSERDKFLNTPPVSRRDRQITVSRILDDSHSAHV